MRIKDWTGNKTFINTNNRNAQAAADDFYATDPRAVYALLNRRSFTGKVWEPACGAGHIVKPLRDRGYDVVASDIVDRGCPETFIYDFLGDGEPPAEARDARVIITNPPYKFAKEFVERGLEHLKLTGDGTLCMFLKLTFLEGAGRYELFKHAPPTEVMVFSKRVCCGKNGAFDAQHNAVAYAWFIWTNGFQGAPKISWFAPDDI